MDSNQSAAPSILCPICHRINPVDQSMKDNSCPVCGHRLMKATLTEHPITTFSLTLTALILCLPANLLPFMSYEFYGTKTESTIWSGIQTLWEDGSPMIAILVFVCSLLIPILKLTILLLIQLPTHTLRWKRVQTSLYGFIELIGPWSMLDIFLVAIFVSVIKLGAMGTVKAESGAFLFLIVICLTMTATQVFRPHMIWRNYAQD